MQASPLSKIRVLCVDDNADAAVLMARCIEFEPDMESAGWLSEADKLCQHVASLRATVVLLDLTMPGQEPLEALREMVSLGASGECGHGVRVIVYSGHKDAATRQQAMDAGAWGFLDKGVPIPALLCAIRDAAHGAAVQAPAV